MTDVTLLPLTELFVDCPYVTSKVKLMVWEDNLPLSYVQVLLGNDLAGDLLLPNQIMSKNHRIREERESESEGKDKPEQVRENSENKVLSKTEESCVNIMTCTWKGKREPQKMDIDSFADKEKVNKERRQKSQMRIKP